VSDLDQRTTRVESELSRAFREIDKNSQGIAVAIAMGGLSLPASKSFALGVNVGLYESKQAISVQGAIRLNEFVSVSGGVGAGLNDTSTVGGRVGLQVAW
jgi:hypothetical protein